MSSTQEKQEHKCHWRAYGQPDGTVVCDECNTAADVNKLIDSATREARIDELESAIVHIKTEAQTPMQYLERSLAQLKSNLEAK